MGGIQIRRYAPGGPGVGAPGAHVPARGPPAPGAATGVVHGCWTNQATKGTHSVVLLNTGAACPSGTTAITWNRTGPAGARGLPGDPGAPGTGGAVGPGG